MAETPNQLVERLLHATDVALVGHYSAVLYGSAVRGNYIPGHSDINLLLILDHVDPSVLRALGRAFRAWRRAKQPLPLVMSRTEWQRSADAFPIEITDMKTAYRVTRGSDPLAHLTVQPRELRQALEREFRGKLMRLRQAFAVLNEDTTGLAEVARESIRSIFPLLRAMLSLEKDVVAPNDPVALVAVAAKRVRFELGALAEIAEHRGDHKWRCPADTFSDYLAGLEAVARHVDELKSGES